MNKLEVGKLYRFTTIASNIPEGTLCTLERVEVGGLHGREGTAFVKRHDNGEQWAVGPSELEPYVDEEEKVVGEVYDPVSKPKHYQLLPGVEVIDVLDALCDKLDNSTLLYNKEVSYYTQAMGYFMRAMDKNGLQDFEKGVWYMQRLIKNIKERQNAGLE